MGSKINSIIDVKKSKKRLKDIKKNVGSIDSKQIKNLVGEYSDYRSNPYVIGLGSFAIAAAFTVTFLAVHYKKKTCTCTKKCCNGKCNCKRNCNCQSHRTCSC